MENPTCLLVTVDFPPLVTGGIQRYYYDICRESQGRIAVLAPLGDGCAEFDKAQPFEVTRIRVPLSPSPLVRALLVILMTFHAARILASGRFEKLIVGHWFLLPALIWIGQIRGIQTAVIMHGGELNRFRSPGGLRGWLVDIVNRCDEVFVNSSFTANQLTEQGVNRSRIKIALPCVDSERYQPVVGGASTLLPGEKEFHGITLLTVATLVERKGHANVISVLPRVLAKHDSVRYVIVGDGPCRASLTAQVDRLGLTRSVHFLGRVTDDEVIQWLQSCDIFVMPSAYLQGKWGEEGFGIVYLEANACGKPVIGGNSGGVPDAVINAVTGLLVDPKDPDALFEALDRLIGNKDLRDTLGKQGRERVIREFQWRDCIQAYIGGTTRHG